MFCTGHTSMTINELVSYTALIRTEFLDEYTRRVGSVVALVVPQRARQEVGVRPHTFSSRCLQRHLDGRRGCDRH